MTLQMLVQPLVHRMEAPPMPGFTITITPSDDPTAQTSIHVDTAPGSARITELTVRSADGGSLPSNYLAGLDLQALIAALPSPVSSASSALSTSSASSAASPPVTTGTGRRAAPETGRGRPRARTTGRRTAAANTASRAKQGTVEARAAAGQPAAGRRAYRRMPEAREVLDAYRAVGGTTALARHFGVPRHTASGWLRRLRQMGLLD
jgi:hypothetical protein